MSGYHLCNKPPQNEEPCDVCGTSLYQRTDDTEDTPEKRLAIFHKWVKRMLAYDRDQGILRWVDAGHSIEETFKSNRIVVE